MLNKRIVILVLMLLIVASGLVFAGNPKDQNSKQIKKTNGLPSMTRFNINNISTYYNTDGSTDINQDGNSGFEFPKGSRKAAVFQSGIVWGANVDGVSTPKVGGSAYRQGLQCGKILSSGVAESPDLTKNRIYRVRADYKIGNFNTEISEEGTDAATVYAQYEKDWYEWPATDGAPYQDMNNNGSYEPAIDIPGVPGADQTVWYVANDLDDGKTTFMYGSQPLGIEVQTTVWGYAQNGPLGNMLFKKYLIINKSLDIFKDMYISQWADPDLGDATDDLAGCDTSLSLGYVYNGKPVDATYGDYPPPAVGWDFFQGPKIAGTSSDQAIFNGKYISGYKNLPMSAFYYFINGDQTYTDPTQGNIAGSQQFYNLMKGLVGKTGDSFIDPVTNQPTKFTLSGDPITNKGWVDSRPDDRRIGLAAGPFTMAVNDTQEVVVAQIAAGAITGVDRLGAIGLLKFYDQIAQQTYNNFFKVAPPPPAPYVTAGLFDRKIVLSWGDSLKYVNNTEIFDSLGYKFQGYNVYQMPDKSSTLDNSSVKRIATFDVVDNIMKIQDDDFDVSSGVVLKKVKQFGSDNGINRSITITTDAIKGNMPLNNFSKYYFAVTAYSYNPNVAVENNKESKPIIYEVIPQSTKPGIRYESIPGDTVVVIHSTKNNETQSEGLVVPIVIDPSRTTGDTYQVTFDTLGAGIVWNLSNTTKSIQLLKNQTNQTADNTYYTIDGIVVKVSGPTILGIKDVEIPGKDFNGNDRLWTWVGSDGLGLEAYNGSIGNAYDYWFNGSSITPDNLPNVLIKFAAADKSGNIANTSDPDVSVAYRYVRNAQNAPAKAEFSPYMPVGKSSYDFCDYSYKIPLAAYNAETGQRLMVGFFENNIATGKVDGKYWPNVATTDQVYSASTDPREWLFVFNIPYDSVNASPLAQVNMLDTDTPSPMFYVVACQRRRDVAWTGLEEFQILANHINKPKDIFTFTAPKVTNNIVDAKVDIDQINVFPNPYYGSNPQEINKYQKFVTFTHLPAQATIKIFNLAGTLVKEIVKDDVTDQTAKWDLANMYGLPVGSGIYVAHIDMPGLGEKILKIAIIQEQQILDRF